MTQTQSHQARFTKKRSGRDYAAFQTLVNTFGVFLPSLSSCVSPFLLSVRWNSAEAAISATPADSRWLLKDPPNKNSDSEPKDRTDTNHQAARWFLLSKSEGLSERHPRNMKDQIEQDLGENTENDLKKPTHPLLRDGH